jgi:putative hydrolase
MMRMLQSEGPVNWDVAEQVATAIALADPSTGAPGTEPSWPASDGERLLELVRLAQRHVATVTGLVGVHRLAPELLGVQELARRTLSGLAPVLEALADTLSAPLRDAAGSEPPPANPFAALTSGVGMEGFLLMLAPVLLGVQAGTMAGHLAHDGLGRYDHPLPIADAELALVPANVLRFAGEWSLERDELFLTLALRETVRAAQRTVGWVGDALRGLATEFVRGYDAVSDEVGGRFADLPLGDTDAVQEMLGDPSALLGMIATPAQVPVRAELHRLVCVLEGYTDVVVEAVGVPLVPSLHRIDEALRRRRIERGQAGTFLDRLLGLDLTRDDFEAGRAFCAGVVERAGVDGLNRLLEARAAVPTPAELEAPGLWLARIDLSSP